MLGLRLTKILRDLEKYYQFEYNSQNEKILKNRSQDEKMENSFYDGNIF